MSNRDPKKSVEADSSANERALTVLKTRYAAGEIDKEEYLEKKEVILESSEQGSPIAHIKSDNRGGHDRLIALIAIGFGLLVFFFFVFVAAPEVETENSPESLILAKLSDEGMGEFEIYRSWRHFSDVSEAEGNLMERGYRRTTASFVISPLNNSVVTWYARLPDEWESGVLAISLHDDFDLIKFIEHLTPSDGVRFSRDISNTYLPSGRYHLVIYSEGYDWTVALATAPKELADPPIDQVDGSPLIDIDEAEIFDEMDDLESRAAFFQSELIAAGFDVIEVWAGDKNSPYPFSTEPFGIRSEGYSVAWILDEWQPWEGDCIFSINLLDQERKLEDVILLSDREGKSSLDPGTHSFNVMSTDCNWVVAVVGPVP